MSRVGVRRIVMAVCAIGIAGMIASSIADNAGAALTAGLATAVAILCLIVATAVTDSGLAPSEELAMDVENRVTTLVRAGADEVAVRDLVGAAVRLGRTER